MSEQDQVIIDFIRNYFQKQSDFDGDGLLDFWHPGGVLYLVGNAGEFRIVTIEEQAAHIKETNKHVPDLTVDFVIDEIDQITIHDDLIASVHVRYRMILPGGYGKHRCFYNLTKINGQWGIVNAVDRGLEVIPEE